MASPIDICNLALYRIGCRRRIESLDEASVEAQACRQFYGLMRDAVLEECAWPFATKRAALALTGTPPEEWEYSYLYPTDCVYVQGIVDGARTRLPVDSIPFTVEQDDAGTLLIYTDQEDAVLVYNTRVEDSGKFPALFVDALGWRLASELSGAIAVDHKGKIDHRALYQDAIQRAIAKVRNEIRPDPPSDPDFVASRI